MRTERNIHWVYRNWGIIMLFGILFSCEAKSQQKAQHNQDNSQLIKFSPKKDFKDFPATVSYASRRSNQQLQFIGNTARHQTVIEKKANGEPNFAGQFKIIEWGEGAGAGNFAVIDFTSGKVYEGIPFGPCGLTFHSNSRMLVVDLPELDKKGYYPADLICKPKVYLWEGTKFKLLE